MMQHLIAQLAVGELNFWSYPLVSKCTNLPLAQDATSRCILKGLRIWDDRTCMMSDSSKSKADETAVPPPTVFSSTPDLFCCACPV